MRCVFGEPTRVVRCALALPKLREVSEEEQIIPDLVTWSALEGITRREAAQKATQLGRVLANFKVFNVSEQDLSKMPDGSICYKPWLHANSELEPNWLVTATVHGSFLG